QLRIASGELRTAVPEGSESTLLLGATGSELLLDGVPLEGSPAEKQFAQLLSAAGLASVQFFSNVTQDEIAKFARAFPAGKAKPSELAQQLKAALEGIRGIRINEVCFVATDSRLKDATSVAAHLTHCSFCDKNKKFKEPPNDPEKLLDLIAAAEGTKVSPTESEEAATSSADYRNVPASGDVGAGSETGGSAYSGDRPSSFSG